MAVRSTMANLIARVRLFINDPAGPTQTWSDQDIQNVLDESRQDIYNHPMRAEPTFSGGTISYFDYFAPGELGDWEDDIVLKQYLNVTVTPATVDDIVGHWTFAASTLPPVFITGKTYDLYRAAADLLERWSAKWALSYNIAVDGQSLSRSQAHSMLLDLAKQYRMKQRARHISLVRNDLTLEHSASGWLGPTEIDYMASG